jgi:DNA-binding MarR family transcriptional regulator
LPDNHETQLFDLADLILAVARLIGAPQDLSPSMCTPVESSVMRYLDRHPGTSARVAADATLLPSSNFSRVLRGLEEKGLVRREVDERDARIVRLYPTALAGENLIRLKRVWSDALEGTIADPAVLDDVNQALRQIEASLLARRGAVAEVQN